MGHCWIHIRYIHKSITKVNMLLRIQYNYVAIAYTVWHAFYVVGASTAVLGKEAAMACTVAVEEAVVEHYNRFGSIVGIYNVL